MNYVVGIVAIVVFILVVIFVPWLVYKLVNLILPDSDVACSTRGEWGYGFLFILFICIFLGILYILFPFAGYIGTDI